MVADASPTARALRALEVIQASPGITAEELGARLGVSARAARRYVAILREADLPVEAERGRYGGYRLGRGLRLPPLLFSASEALGLVMAALDGHHGAGDPNDPVGAALGKIIRALPEAVGRPAAMLRAHASSAPVRGPRPDRERLTTVVGAVAAQRRLRVTYLPASGRELTTEVDPWAVVVRHGVWYLLCHSHTAGALRTYRVERIRRAVPLDVAFEPPPDLDPIALLEEHLGRGWEFGTSVVLEAPLAEARQWVRAPMGRLEAIGEDRCRLTGTTSNPQMYAAEWLAALPFGFRVEGGAELVAATRALAERIARAVD